MRRTTGWVAAAVLAFATTGCGGGNIDEGIPEDTLPNPAVEAALKKMSEGMLKTGGEKAAPAPVPSKTAATAK
jgi:hypothetical protein